MPDIADNSRTVYSATAHFSSLPSLITSATRGSDLYPEGYDFLTGKDWKKSLTRPASLDHHRRQVVAQYPELEVLDLQLLLWQAGVRVGEQYGYRLPFTVTSDHPGGLTPVGRIESWLNEDSRRIHR